MKRSLATRVLALVLVASLQTLFFPASAGEATASLTGTLVSSASEAPLAGARLHVGDPRTGLIYSSDPTDVDGSFHLVDLPAASYELAVESGGALFVVESALKLSPGEVRAVTVEVNQQAAPGPDSEEKKRRKGAGFWNNPVTAALVVVGSATVLGYLIKKGTDDETSASPSSL